jgi:MoxR-like ATPase
MTESLDFAHEIGAFRRDLERIEAALTAAIVGQDELLREVLTAFLAGGHVLLEGLPGLGKTQLAKGLARVIGETLARVQCTPDLMPSDIVGSEILTGEKGDGARDLRFRPGPIFAPLVLVDEINRATPRTQSALLEAMQERQVTVGAQRRPLPPRFWVVATQNPIELEGTYPLPEAQLDRFFFKCCVPYPDPSALLGIADVSLDAEPVEGIEPVVGPARFAEMAELAREILVSESVKRDAIALVLATQPRGANGSPLASRYLRHGASPRGLQTLLRAARVRALADGRGHVGPDDLTRVARPALRHRVLLNPEAEIEGIRIDDVLEEILAAWQRSR